MNWIATAFTYQAAMPAWLGVLAVIVLSLYLALFPALTALVAWRIGRDRDRGIEFVLAFAGAWIVVNTCARRCSRAFLEIRWASCCSRYPRSPTLRTGWDRTACQALCCSSPASRGLR